MDDKVKKIEEAKELLEAFGLPKNQFSSRNDRSARVLLGMAGISPTDSWSDATASMLTTHELIIKIKPYYEYQVNSRENIRKGSLHILEAAGMVERNQDNQERATNDGFNNYILNEKVLEVLKSYPHDGWRDKLKTFLLEQPSLIKKYNKKVEKARVSITLPNGEKVSLSPGKHNQLHAEIIENFCPRFVRGKRDVLYLGDTASSRGEGGKLMILEKEKLENLGVPPFAHDKLPDVVVFDDENNWLFLIEAVTSRGPVDELRKHHLEQALSNCNAGIVYVTAFLDRQTFRKYAADIAWETEVWVSDNPEHMIHFNGDRFLGPH